MMGRNSGRLAMRGLFPHPGDMGGCLYKVCKHGRYVLCTPLDLRFEKNAPPKNVRRSRIREVQVFMRFDSLWKKSVILEARYRRGYVSYREKSVRAGVLETVGSRYSSHLSKPLSCLTPHPIFRSIPNSLMTDTLEDHHLH